MINYKEFEIIKTLVRADVDDRDSALEFVRANVYHYVFKSGAELKKLFDGLCKKEYLCNGRVTDLGMKELAALKVDNAIILAAGGGDITAKSVYSMPKGLFVKNGETLIERQIRQLKEAGIDDITVVIGYKQELYFFLQDKWNVNLIINPDLKKNNIYSLYCAENKLGATYICNCDNYFDKNPFSKYEFDSYHATVKKMDAKNELVIEKNEEGRILRIFSNVKSGECIYGHAFLDKDTSKRLRRFLKHDIEDFRISQLFWEEYIGFHANDLTVFAHEYPSDFVFEFDSIQEIQNIDGLFLDSVSGRINEKICEVLKCEKYDICDIVILQKGLTNILFTFVVRGERYIFRYPGDSSVFFIYRKNECVAQKLAAKAHADDTYVYIDETGIKISKYRENCIDLHGRYYYDVELMKQVAKKIKAFHDVGYDMADWQNYDYDPIYQCERLFKEASKMKGNLMQIFAKEWEVMRKLQKYADMDGVKHTMCHNDINIDNVLLTDRTLDIIDWEFAGFNDPGYDFGRVIAGFEYEPDEPKIDEILAAYFGHTPSVQEKLHWMAYSAIHNWYYVGWALYKESINESSRDWMLFFFKQSKKLAAWCLPQYEKIYGKI